MIYSERFTKAFYFTLKNEGGYVDDRHDPGGATNYGISLRFLKSQKDGDINKDGIIDKQDIQELTSPTAKLFYYREFWQKVEMISYETLAIKVFDFGVNLGIKKAIKLLQNVLKVEEDGIIGPKTLNAIRRSRKDILQKYIDRVKLYYNEIIYNNPPLKKYKSGWYARAERFPK